MKEERGDDDRTEGFSTNDFAKYDVLIVEMRCGRACDEELRAVSVRTCVGLRVIR